MRTLIASALFLLATPVYAADWTPADQSSITLDASVTHDAKPDIINLSVTCEITEPASRTGVRELSNKYLQDFKTIAGDNAVVRRNGPPSVYLSYSDIALTSNDQKFQGTMYFGINKIKPDAAMKIADAVEDKGCVYTWDARLLYTTTYARSMKSELMEQIQDKQKFIEELLGITLNKVSYLNFSTTPDYSAGGYYGGGAPNYDPETNTLQALTTLSVTFDTGTGKAAPKN